MVTSSVGSLNKPSYSKESLATATVAMLMSIIMTCAATVTRWLAVSKGSLLYLEIYRLLHHFISCLLLWARGMIIDSCHIMLMVHILSLFFKSLTSHLQERITLDPKLHLARTSDRVVTMTSNLNLLGKKTWGIY